MMNKETIKEFLKPDKRKAVLFLILFLFFPIIFSWIDRECPMYETLVGISRAPCDKIALRISIGWVIKAIIDETKRTPLWSTNFLEIRTLPPRWYPFYYIYHLLIIYTLSCAIFFIYDRIKKDKTAKSRAIQSPNRKLSGSALHSLVLPSPYGFRLIPMRSTKCERAD